MPGNPLKFFNSKLFPSLTTVPETGFIIPPKSVKSPAAPESISLIIIPPINAPGVPVRLVIVTEPVSTKEI